MNKSVRSFKKFLLLWSGQLVSSIGGGLTSFGLGIYVFQQTGKASAIVDDGLLVNSMSKIIGTGSRRGTGFLIIIVGVLLCATSVILCNLKLVKKIERRGYLCITE